MQNKISARQIVALLGQKHLEDVFVSECKTGPSQAAEHARMDAWAMEKSWAHPRVIAYEVKVSRSDFLNDTKWRSYLPFCNELNFVCPKGLIKPEELPNEIGLFYVASTGNKLFTQRRAQYRDVQIPESLWRYILMCRAQISRYDLDQDKTTYWKHWMEAKLESRDLGYKVSRKIQDHVRQVEAENSRLKEDVKAAEEVRKILERHGLGSSLTTWNLERRIKAITSAVPEDLIEALQRSMHSAGTAIQQLEALNRQRCEVET